MCVKIILIENNLKHQSGIGSYSDITKISIYNVFLHHDCGQLLV